MKIVCALLLAFVCTTACEKTVYTRGYAMDFSDFNKIKIGKDDAQAVFEKIGSPTMRSSVEDENGGYSWYYVYKRTEKNGFLDAKVLDAKTMVVTFNSKGIVASISENTNERRIDIMKDHTDTSGKGTGITNEIFGGLGKYRKQYQKD